MLKWALIFLVIAVIAGIFGFSGVESATIAQWLFLGALIIGLTLGAKLTGYLPEPCRYDCRSFQSGCTHA